MGADMKTPGEKAPDGGPADGGATLEDIVTGALQDILDRDFDGEPHMALGWVVGINAIDADGKTSTNLIVSTEDLDWATALGLAKAVSLKLARQYNQELEGDEGDDDG